MAALLEVLTILKVDDDWVSDARGDPAIQEVLNADIDGSGMITQVWFDRSRSILEPLGVSF